MINDKFEEELNKIVKEESQREVEWHLEQNRKEPLGKGIIEQISRQKTPIVFSKKDIEETLKSLSTVPKQGRIFKIYTGETGMWKFNWIMIYGDTIKCKYYLHRFNRTKGIQLSLFKKSGNIKLVVLGTTFRFFYGTELIKEFTDVTNEWFNQGDIKDKKTQLKIDEVNHYIDNVVRSIQEKDDVFTIAKLHIDTMEKERIIKERQNGTI